MRDNIRCVLVIFAIRYFFRVFSRLPLSLGKMNGVQVYHVIGVEPI